MTRLITIFISLLSASLLFGGVKAGEAATGGEAFATARVLAVESAPAGELVLLDGGREVGLRTGMMLTIERDNRRNAQLVLAVVSANNAVGLLTQSDEPLLPGAIARLKVTRPVS